MGLVFAIDDANSASEVEIARWVATTGVSVDTEGGNISQVTLGAYTLTDRWAAFFGNISGSLNLTDASATNNVYSWAWDADGGGEVCASEGNDFDWTAVSTATAVAVDTAWGFGNVADNATETFTTSGCNLAFEQGSVAATIDVAHQGSSTFTTCGVDDGGATETDFAFCTNISSTGVNYNGTGAMYEIMVPTTAGSAVTETYFFFVELN
ncbi:MAG: hypothetical protein ABII71_00460 [Candidatus Micrarchaeota archaeon]